MKNIKLYLGLVKQSFIKDIKRIVNTKIKSDWQAMALEAVKELGCKNKERARVFKCYKENKDMANKALADCRELGKLNMKYFLKLWNIYKK